MGIYLGGNKYHLSLSGSQVLRPNYRIPREYQEVEWIQAWHSSGAYIDLGFTFDTACEIEIGFRLIGTAAGYLFGAAESSGTLRCQISAPYGEGNIYAYGSTGTSYNTVSTTAVCADGEAIKGEINEVTFKLEKGKISLHNKTTGASNTYASQGEYKMSSNLYLLGQNYNGTPRFGRARTVSKFKYYDKNGDLICNLIPCYRKSDMEVGMYDVVRKIFLTNVGSGSFTMGMIVGTTNWALNSMNVDGTTYNNGLGYKDGYRVRSGGEEASQSTAVCTGYIPFKKGDTLRIYPPFSGKNTENAINFVDANFTNLGQITDNGGGAYGICVGHYNLYRPTTVGGVSTLTFTEEHDDNIAYVRVTHYKTSSGIANYGVKTGSEMIITVNE